MTDDAGNRYARRPERLPGRPDRELKSLADLSALVLAAREPEQTRHSAICTVGVEEVTCRVQCDSHKQEGMQEYERCCNANLRRAHRATVLRGARALASEGTKDDTLPSSLGGAVGRRRSRRIVWFLLSAGVVTLGLLALLGLL